MCLFYKFLSPSVTLWTCDTCFSYDEHQRASRVWSELWSCCYIRGCNRSMLMVPNHSAVDRVIIEVVTLSPAELLDNVSIMLIRCPSVLYTTRHWLFHHTQLYRTVPNKCAGRRGRKRALSLKGRSHWAPGVPKLQLVDNSHKSWVTRLTREELVATHWVMWCVVGNSGRSQKCLKFPLSCLTARYSWGTWECLGALVAMREALGHRTQRSFRGNSWAKIAKSCLLKWVFWP